MSKETTDIKIEKLGMEAKPYDKVLAKVAELCPAAVQNGKVDFERLKAELADVVDENARETYEFKWVGKNAAMVEANKPIRKTLRPCKEESKNWDATENLYIEGDNLEVLKLLEEGYLGKIKMIYIDPPYNTGNDFVYHDNRVQSEEEMNQGIDLFDEEDNRLLSKSFVRNTESSGRFHSDWCSMMYPRLKLARDLLTDDGVIFISINDKEVDNLKKICLEIYGEHNFLATLIWDKNVSAQAGIYKVYHEYILVFCKSIADMHIPYALSDGIFDAAAVKKVSGRHPATQFKFPKGTRFDAPDGTIIEGIYGDTIKIKVIDGQLIAKDGKLQRDVVLEAGFTQANQMKQYFYGDRNNLFDTQGQKIIEFYFNSTGKIQISKQRGVEVPQTTCKFGTQASATQELMDLFETSEAPFSSPKPIAMIYDFIQRFTKDSDIILDFFSGSATTAHALFKANCQNKMHRKFILVQLEEDLDESLKQAQKDAVNTLKVGIEYLDSIHKPHKITEIGKQRIRLAGEKIKSEYSEITDLDIGFRVLKVDDSNMQDVYYKPSELKQADLLSSIDNIKADRTPLDLLFGVMVEWGVSLSLPLQEVKVGENTIHIVGDNDLVACFDKNVSTATITKMAELNPTRVVFRDSCFEKDDEKINMFEIFKTICHWDDKQAKDNVRVM